MKFRIFLNFDIGTLWSEGLTVGQMRCGGEGEYLREAIISKFSLRRSNYSGGLLIKSCLLFEEIRPVPSV